ncbi:unnamed protein product [marine sediment metagenome]|uniref:Uncharacterized protein n=1 Tax=marine sediment metagenome TaxID=412755 RepID=X1JR38_9ZZZZ
MVFKRIKGKGPERIKVAMLDPVMAPGDARTAVAPITVSPAGLGVWWWEWCCPGPGIDSYRGGSSDRCSNSDYYQR